MKRTLLFAVLLAAGVAEAQPMPPGPPAPPAPPPLDAPSPEALARVPGLDAAKQVEVRKLLLQRRDAHEALRAKEDAERDAMRLRYRAEHERIDDDSSARLRTLLGGDGYHALAAGLVPPHREIGRGAEGPAPMMGRHPPTPDARDLDDPATRTPPPAPRDGVAPAPRSR